MGKTVSKIHRREWRSLRDHFKHAGRKGTYAHIKKAVIAAEVFDKSNGTDFIGSIAALSGISCKLVKGLADNSPNGNLGELKAAFTTLENTISTILGTPPNQHSTPSARRERSDPSEVMRAPPGLRHKAMAHQRR